MDARTLKVEEIHPSPDNIRHRIGRLKELKESIEAVGLLQPIVVTKNTEGYAIVAGHRRFAAVKELGWTEVDVVVREFEDAEKIEAMIVENFHREDLSPIEQAEGLFALAELGLNQKTIAAKTGLSAKLVGERIRLLDLPKTGQEMLHQGQLSIEAGLTLAKEATDVDLVTEALAYLSERNTSDVGYALRQVRETREKAEKEAKLLDLVAKLQEQGREVVTATESENGYYGSSYQTSPSSWKAVIDAEEGRYYGTDKLPLGNKAHAREECAVWWYTPAHGHYAAKLVHLCRKPSRHAFTGDSELKLPDAEEVAKTKASDSAARKKERELRKATDERYQAALAKKPPKPLMFDVAWRGFVKETWGEHRKRAAILLGLEPIMQQGSKSYDRPFLEFAEANPERAVMALYLAKDDPLWKSKYRDGTFEGLADDLQGLIPEAGS